MTPPEEIVTADSLLKEADVLFQKREYDNALSKYLAALDTARREFNPSIETEALSQIARMHLASGRKDEGRSWVERAAARAVVTDSMGYSRFLSIKGRYEWKDGELTTSAQTFAEMYDFCLTNSLHSRAIDAANMLAIVSEDPQVKIEWSRKGIQAAEAGKVESWLGPLWNNLAATFYEMKHFDSALACYETAREYHWRHSLENAKLFADYHVGMTLRHLGRFAEAESWLRPVLAWAERLQNHGCVAQALEDLAEIAIARGDAAAGLEDLKRAKEEYELAQFNLSSPEIYVNISNRITALEAG